MTRKKEKEEGMAEGVIREFGFGGLIDTLKKSPAFKERLRVVNEQIEQNIKEGKGTRPSMRTSFHMRTLPPKRGFYKRGVKVERKKVSLEEQEPLLDIFDEGEYVRIVASLPGAKEKNINVGMMEDKLIISTDVLDNGHLLQKNYKEVSLPCPVKGKIKSSYKNGILEVRLKKKVG